MNEKKEERKTSKRRFPMLWAILVAAAVLILAGGGILWGLGYLPGMGGPGGGDEALHHCPMHPTVVQAGPGDCPICGMRLVPVEEEVHESHAGPGGGDGALHHCPMHPTVVQEGPGDCPICGMHLVPVEEDREAHAGHGGGDETLYHCPMHPTVVKDGPGDCPICSMRLVPVEQEDRGEAAAGAVGEEMEGHAPVRMTDAKQQLIGVRTDPVRRIPLRKEIRTVGVVEEDETRVRHIHTKITGWIEDLYVDFTGKEVRKGEKLLSIYSPELVSTQEEYLLALRGRERLSSSPFPEVSGSGDSLLRSTRQRLELWDISDSEIERLEETGEPIKNLVLYSPISGHVLHKTALEGMYVTPGKELFTIADLSRVWVHADVYEYELPLVEVGQEATLTFASYPGETFHGRVDYVYPTLDPKTRTAKVRFRFPNPNLKLKPQMYANVRFEKDLGEMLAVPAEAVMDTGTRQIVFVAQGDGWFAPREIEVGFRARGYQEVLSGLEPGMRVVTNGNFLIDSESRLKSSIAAAASKGKPSSGAGAHAGH